MTTNDTRDGAPNGIWVACLWTGLGLFDAMQTVFVMHSEGMHHAWAILFAVTVVSWLPWALATPLILRLCRRFPPIGVRPYRKWLAHIAAATIIGFMLASWTTLLHLAFNPYADAHPPGFVPLLFDTFSNGMLSSLVLYAGILTVNYGLEYRARLAFAQTETARLNEGLSKAQLNALRRQIEPHSLFNALNAVAGLVREGRNDAAVQMIAALSDFLRRMLKESNRQEVPLHEEMTFVGDYLAIAKARFAERLTVIIDIPVELQAVPIPNFILQPLVENAIKHGISQRAEGGTIRIGANRRDNSLVLSVSNDGPNLPARREASAPGIGITNVRDRLQTLYGTAFDFSIANQRSGGVEVTVSLPLRNVPSLA